MRHFFLNSELLWQQSLRLAFFKPRANDWTTKQFILLRGMFFLKLCTNGYIETMNVAWGHDSPSSLQFSGSVVSDFLWPHGLSMPDFPVHHQLLEFTQTHVHRVGWCHLLLNNLLTNPGILKCTLWKWVFWGLCRKLSLSFFHCNKTSATQKLWVIKPCLWPWIETVSSENHKSDTIQHKLSQWASAQGIKTGSSVITSRGGNGQRWEGDSGGRGHIYTYDWFILMHGSNQTSIVNQPSIRNNCYFLKKK